MDWFDLSPVGKRRVTRAPPLEPPVSRFQKVLWSEKGFEAVISLFPQMKIVKTQSGNFTTDGGKQVMEAFIKATDNLKGVCGVFAHNDNMQLGAIQAMKEAGLKPGKDFLVVSVDYVPAMKQALAAGELERVGRTALGDRQVHLPGRGRLPEGQERAAAEVGGDPVQPARCGDAGQLNARKTATSGSASREREAPPFPPDGPLRKLGSGQSL